MINPETNAFHQMMPLANRKLLKNRAQWFSSKIYKLISEHLALRQTSNDRKQQLNQNKHTLLCSYNKFNTYSNCNSNRTISSTTKKWANKKISIICSWWLSFFRNSLNKINWRQTWLKVKINWSYSHKTKLKKISILRLFSWSKRKCKRFKCFSNRYNSPPSFSKPKTVHQRLLLKRKRSDKNLNWKSQL